ncbi:MAG: NAD-dependent epimerase/dehydratase family protein [Pseudomonadota bacterium]
MATYLITGGCGFIGSHLVDKLIEKQHQCIVVDDLSTGKKTNLNSKAELIVGDVSDEKLIQQILADCDGCFHLAAVASIEKSNRDWLGTHRTNLTGSINIFDKARRENQPALPVVFASSAAVYGDNQNIPLNELAKTKPLTAYGADKLGSELHALIAAKVHHVPVTALRFFNVYGPRQDPNSPYSGVISIFVNNILQAKPITIYGDGEQTRDFIYVADVVRYCLQAMERLTKPGFEVYNVCTGNKTNLLELIKIITTIFNKHPEIIMQERRQSKARTQIHFSERRRGDIQESLGDPNQAIEQLGVVAKFNLNSGLETMLTSRRVD